VRRLRVLFVVPPESAEELLDSLLVIQPPDQDMTSPEPDEIMVSLCTLLHGPTINHRIVQEEIEAVVFVDWPQKEVGKVLSQLPRGIQTANVDTRQTLHALQLALSAISIAGRARQPVNLS
jgi:hypothetical protein